MMKVYLILFFFTGMSCAEKKSNILVRVESAKDTLKVGEVYSANIFCEYNEVLSPADFYIVQNCDTFLLEYVGKDRYAKFKSVSNKIGQKEYNGFVSLKDNNGNIRTKEFSILYFVE